VKRIRELHARDPVDVVHQPTPVSPKEPAILHRQPAPLLVGPLNGGMTYPPAFAAREGRLVSRFMRGGRMFSRVIHALAPGRRRAALVLVANERTRDALPRHMSASVELMVENGVDLSLWHTSPSRNGEESPTRF